jgi:hypothetical protein
LDCGITVVDVSASDDGQWKCHAKDDVRQGDVVETSFKISVASPFSVAIVPPGRNDTHGIGSFCRVLLSRVARWHIFKPKIPIWVNF